MVEQDSTRPVIIDPEGYQAPDPAQKNYVYVTYALYVLGVFTLMTPLAGVILAYIKRDEMQGTLYYAHMCFLIKTFWGMLVGAVIGFVLAFVGIGFLILALVAVWYVFRMVLGVVRLIDNKPITPDGWLM